MIGMVALRPVEVVMSREYVTDIVSSIVLIIRIRERSNVRFDVI